MYFILHVYGIILFRHGIHLIVIPQIQYADAPFFLQQGQDVYHSLVLRTVISCSGINDKRAIPGILHIHDNRFHGPRYSSRFKSAEIPAATDGSQWNLLRRIVGRELTYHRIKPLTGTHPFQAGKVRRRIPVRKGGTADCLLNNLAAVQNADIICHGHTCRSWAVGNGRAQKQQPFALQWKVSRNLPRLPATGRFSRFHLYWHLHLLPVSNLILWLYFSVSLLLSAGSTQEGSIFMIYLKRFLKLFSHSL